LAGGGAGFVALLVAILAVVGVFSPKEEGGPAAREEIVGVEQRSNSIVFASERDGNGEIYVMNADGSSRKRLTYNEADDRFPAFAPMYVDGRLLDIYGR
jgi:hypothetical protein